MFTKKETLARIFWLRRGNKASKPFLFFAFASFVVSQLLVDI